jgi:hypothetical protein
VEVRRIVIAVEHGDRDPVERADSWHHSNVRTVCDTARTGHHNPTGFACLCAAINMCCDLGRSALRLVIPHE